MCLLLISYKNHPIYKLIIAANRDEFYNRPALPANYWQECPFLLGGRDLKAGGTWLGITKQGRFSAITNYRDMRINKENAPSRGNLTTNFLTGEFSAKEYLDRLKQSANKYNGYNLIFGDIDDLFYFSNQAQEHVKLTPGIYGLSNHLLDTPWPKVEKSKKSFNNILTKDNISAEDLFNILSDKSLPPDDLLPDTGLKIEIERAVSPVFVETPFYGTRSSTVIFCEMNNKITFYEKSLDVINKTWSKTVFEFQVF